MYGVSDFKQMQQMFNKSMTIGLVNTLWDLCSTSGDLYRGLVILKYKFEKIRRKRVKILCENGLLHRMKSNWAHGFPSFVHVGIRLGDFVKIEISYYNGRKS